MGTLIHLIYASRAAFEPTPWELAEILRVSRRNNEREGVTGILLYTAGSFFQVLEGPAETVDRRFSTISGDVRHTHPVTIIRERIAERTFGEWSMGFVTGPADEIAAVAGLNDFFTEASCFDRLDRGRARKLLSAFREGRWRARPDGVEPAFADRVSLVNA